MAKRIGFPARLVIEFNHKDGAVIIESCSVRYTLSAEEYPEFGAVRATKQLVLSQAELTRIKNFCYDVILAKI